MKTIAQKYLVEKQTRYWNAACYTAGMGVVKSRRLPTKNPSGFGMIKTPVDHAGQSDHTTDRINFQPAADAPRAASLRRDKSLAHSVDRILVWMKTFPEDAVRVSIHDGWMTLTGKVDWQFQPDLTIASLASLYGVKGYTNHIVVLHPED